MRCIEEPVQALAIPTNADVDRSAEYLGQAPKRPDLYVIEPAGLDLADQLPGDADKIGNVPLPPPTPDA